MAVAVGVSGDVGSDDLRMLPSERRLALARACCNSDIFQDNKTLIFDCLDTLRVPFVFYNFILRIATTTYRLKLNHNISH